jgi:hypothetical protein
MRPVIEQNQAPQKHPGAEVDVGLSDAATVRAIKGKGIVATLPSHFVVAVIVGLVGYFAAHKPDPVSADIGNEARRCNESVTQLRADFTQYKAERSLVDMMTERKLNELLSRTWISSPSNPSIQPSSLGIGVSRELSGH